MRVTLPETEGDHNRPETTMTDRDPDVQDDPLPGVLTIHQAAQVVGVPYKQILAAAHRGTVPAVQYGERRFVPTAKLAEQLGLTLEQVRERLQ